VTFQIYLRVHREGIVLAAMVLELVTMASVTLLFRHLGPSAPAVGQLAARVLGCAVVATPMLLARAGRLSWFEDDRAEPAPAAPVGLAREPMPG
jgi:hypothetical protein